MNQDTIQAALSDLPLGGLRYFEQIGSTNDVALEWLNEKDVQDFSLVIANEQTTGRGRSGRIWQTPPDSALALSLLLLPISRETKNISHFTGLGALALTTALEDLYTLKTEIKWPNDVLLNKKKLAGILVEASWLGESPKGIVLGMGVNIRAESVPLPKALNFPATSLEEELDKPVERTRILNGILSALLKWRPLLGTDEMVAAWDERLAFRSEQVSVGRRGRQVIHGKVLGINKDGSLRLDTADSVLFGDVHLRPRRV
ncbi:MAG: biotin--[acetyl-CoA-carboxylase] ligase [Anaerolineae bacterium]|jgi:BirA family transcriptional regulator, biotin operon repressor / biotin---[acetyl-CoA-carboxylase] ligase|nr:biotin--[acetyl-CoA-carboxylase] ligase [Anaerolineae bacterium]MBT7071084.1 biotin--[acetyl-CoA-carboxylase] ligase [Anaerolineae bacterium]MBT7324050.1 biotin--[acetyl-CoA-carboxylase] ligase [Anaerolineae bacterium]